MAFTFEGHTFDPVPHSKMSPAEIDVLERCVGLNYDRIKYEANKCVCDHAMERHIHVNKKGRVSEETSCLIEDCRCGRFTSDIPTRINYAFIWIALRRVAPEVSFDALCEVPQDALKLAEKPSPAGDAVDPSLTSEPEE